MALCEGAPSFADSSLRRAWNTTRRRPGHGPWSDSELPFTRCPHARAYGGRRSSCDVRRRGRTPLRLGRREDAVLSLSRPAASFTSITASQKAATASHSVSLRSMAETNAGRERSPPIAAVRTRRCSAQAGQSCTVCSTVSSGRSSQWQHPGTTIHLVNLRINIKGTVNVEKIMIWFRFLSCLNSTSFQTGTKFKV